MQGFWKWVVLKVPEWWAPNAMTLAGLIINMITSAILMWYSPDGKGEVGSRILTEFSELYSNTVHTVALENKKRL